MINIKYVFFIRFSKGLIGAYHTDWGGGGQIKSPFYAGVVRADHYSPDNLFDPNQTCHAAGLIIAAIGEEVLGVGVGA